MRAAVIQGPGNSARYLKQFQQNSSIAWSSGLPPTSSDADVILILGGDGTIHRHLADLVKLQLPVLMVPCGSGNDFARALNLRTVRDSLRAWNDFQSGGDCVRAIDLGNIKVVRDDSVTEPASAVHYFCCVACVGLDAAVARRANHLPLWLRGHGGYALSLPVALLKFKSFDAKVTVSHEEVSARSRRGRLMLAAFANTPAYGDGAKIAPKAELEDGKLDVCTVKEMGRVHLLSVFPSVYFGRHLSLSQVEYFQTENLKMETGFPMDVFADGEYVCQTPVEVSVGKKLLRVVVKWR